MIHTDVFVHKKALVDEGVIVWASSRIWGLTHLLSGAQIGTNHNICNQEFVEGIVIKGDRVTIN